MLIHIFVETMIYLTQDSLRNLERTAFIWNINLLKYYVFTVTFAKFNAFLKSPHILNGTVRPELTWAK